MDDEDDCAALLFTSPHRALMLPVIMSSGLAGNIGRAVWAAIQMFSNASAMTATVALLPELPHYCRSSGSPILLRCLFTQSQAA